MNRVFHTLLLLVWAMSVNAQPNLYIPNGKHTLSTSPYKEFGGNIYYLTQSFDTTTQGFIVGSTFFVNANKYNGQLNKSMLVRRDTARNPYDYGAPGRVAFALNKDSRTFSFLFDTYSDSSLFEASPVRKYPKRINYIVVDTGLTVVIPSKPIFYDERSDRYRVEGVYSALAIGGNRTVLTYLVCDTAFLSSAPAAKLLIIDNAGTIISDKFLGWEPEGKGTRFPSHQCLSEIQVGPNKNYSVLGFYFDSLFYGVPFSLINLDSNFDLTSVSEYPEYYTGTPSQPMTSSNGKTNIYFGGDGEGFILLPSGGFVRSSGTSYRDDSTGIYYSTNGLGKTEGPINCRPGYIYMAPRVDGSDKSHTTMYSISKLVYNSWDNRIYSFSSTNSQASFYCIDGISNFGQVVSVDTNLNESWVKYIRPRPGFCIRSSTIVAPDRRGGVLISGWEFDITDRGNPKSEKPFIYYVDSNTQLSANEPNSPLIISDQFSVYPNPALSHLTIENIPGTSFQYILINALGQTVQTGALTGKKSVVDLSACPGGLYLLNLYDGNKKIQSFKLSKE